MRNRHLRSLAAGLFAFFPALSSAATAAPGWAVSTFASGFVNSGAWGPTGIASDLAGNIYVQDYISGGLYKFGPAGGTASAATLIGSNPASTILGLTFSKDGRLYATDINGFSVVELDPGTAAIKRTVISGFTGYGIATDPLSGDLFVAGIDGVIYRISNFSSGPGVLSSYAPVAADGLAFGSDGTLYAANGPSVSGAGYLVRIGGTNTSQPAAFAQLAMIPSLSGLAVALDNSFVVANDNNGTITRLDLTTLAQTVVVSGGSRGDFVTVGKDACLYATQTDSVLKVTASNGTCQFAATPSVPPTSKVNVRFHYTACVSGGSGQEGHSDNPAHNNNGTEGNSDNNAQCGQSGGSGQEGHSDNPAHNNNGTEGHSDNGGQNGSAGSWSATQTVGASGGVFIGPQAMEGNLVVFPGDTLSAGYDFTIPGQHVATTIFFSHVTVTFQAACLSKHNGGTIVISIPDASYPDPANSSSWYPSADQSSPSVFQGSINVPDLCSGGGISLAAGGTFSATVGSLP